jgi:ribonuclease R
MALAEIGRDGARVLALLGSPDRARDVVDALLVDRGVHSEFPPAVDAEAADAASAPAAAEGRRVDLTDLPTFTVDPASARDFDDAVSAERTEEGFRIWVHIADVAEHVRPGTALDLEAYRRATSTYVPGAVAPMLPASLSEGACSLSPGVPRNAVTAELELSSEGEPIRERFHRTLIRSDARLDYDELDKIFASRAKAPEPIQGPLEVARAAAAALRARRPESAIGLSTTEPEFEFSGADVVGAHRLHQTEAHQLIEQLMVTCNERVATLLERRRIPSLYRVHEEPEPARVGFLFEQLAALDLPTPALPKQITATEAGRLAGDASRLVTREGKRRGHGQDAYSSLVLRSLQRAVYSERNLGHAGLGSPAYAHFTSPIRRYPDLIAHRALLSALDGQEPVPDGREMKSAALHCSEREREASSLERDADDVCAAFLLERELYEAGWDHEFEGEVSGVIAPAAFVSFGGKLGDVYEGFLPARLLGGERFDLDETETALVGRRSGRRLRFGDPIQVKVEAIEKPRGRVDLAPAAALEA